MLSDLLVAVMGAFTFSMANTISPRLVIMQTVGNALAEEAVNAVAEHGPETEALLTLLAASLAQTKY